MFHIPARNSCRNVHVSSTQVKATNEGMTYYGGPNSCDSDDTTLPLDCHDSPMFPDDNADHMAWQQDLHQIKSADAASACNIVSTTESDYGSDDDSSYDDDAWYAHAGIHF